MKAKGNESPRHAFLLGISILCQTIDALFSMKQMLKALKSILWQFYLITCCTTLISNRQHVHLGAYTQDSLNYISILPSQWLPQRECRDLK